MSSHSEPARDGVLVLAIDLAEARLQCALFQRHVEEHARSHECNQDSDAPVKDDSPEQLASPARTGEGGVAC